eukprot:216877-Chlamydomonas_euryale.AAC.4
MCLDHSADDVIPAVDSQQTTTYGSSISKARQHRSSGHTVREVDRRTHACKLDKPLWMCIGGCSSYV